MIVENEREQFCMITHLLLLYFTKKYEHLILRKRKKVKNHLFIGMIFDLYMRIKLSDSLFACRLIFQVINLGQIVPDGIFLWRSGNYRYCHFGYRMNKFNFAGM